MRTDVIAVTTPGLDHDAGFLRAAEPLQRLALDPDRAVEALSSALLPGFVGLDEPSRYVPWQANRGSRVKGSTIFPVQDSVVSSARTKPAFSFSLRRYELPRMLSVTE